MKKLFVPENEVELSFVRGLLESNGIRFFVHNDHYGSLYVGPQIELLNRKAVMVDERDEARALELLDTFLTPVEGYEDEPETAYSFWQKLRMVVESMMFFWYVPGGKRRKK